MRPITKAVIAVDYTGQPCDYDSIRSVCDKFGLYLVADACHALGGNYKGRSVGSLADLNTFSFHPAKHITTGEGGAVTTNNAEYALRMRRFRNHGIDSDFRQRVEKDSWIYNMIDLGYNYRITDIQCALGISHLKKLDQWVTRRREIAQIYDDAFKKMPAIIPLAVRPDCRHAYHLYVIRLDLDLLKADRETIFRALRAEGIGVNVHYIPVHLHSYYRQHFNTGFGLCPIAEKAYHQILSIPIFPRMTDADVQDVIDAFNKVIKGL